MTDIPDDLKKILRAVRSEVGSMLSRHPAVQVARMKDPHVAANFGFKIAAFAVLDTLDRLVSDGLPASPSAEREERKGDALENAKALIEQLESRLQIVRDQVNAPLLKLHEPQERNF